MPATELIDPSALLQRKLRHTQDLLKETHLFPERLLEPLAAASSRAYRRKARLGVRCDESSSIALVGFRRRGHRHLAELDQCPVLVPALSRLIGPLRALIPRLKACERIPKIEAAAGDDGVILRLRILSPLPAEDRSRLVEFGLEKEIGLEVEEGPQASITSLTAPETLHYSLPGFDLSFRFRATDFVQINGEMNRRLIEQTLALLAPQPCEKALDLFSGIGNFSLPLAKFAEAVVGVEGSPASVELARNNASSNSIANANFIHANLYGKDFPPAIRRENFDIAILDPPRSGVDTTTLSKLPDLGIKRLAYVSCQPQTLARDAKILVHRLGYRLSAFGVADMFPTTAHIECLALFHRP